MAKKKPKKGELRASAEKVWLAGLGALATAEEEGGKAFKSLVRKGERYQKSIKKPVGDAKKKVGDAFDHQVTMTLHRLGVPTRKEIADLTLRVEQLTRRFEATPETAKKAAGKKKTTAKKKVAAKKTT